MPRRQSLLAHPRACVGKIISGGQTGVDRAALDAAIRLGIPHGGWVPRGRRAEDGKLHVRYQVQETGSHRLSLRTEWNVRDADATLIFTTNGKLTGGTARTAAFAYVHQKPWLHVNLGLLDHLPRRALVIFLRGWVAHLKPSVLNVAGPRASKDPKIYRMVLRILFDVFADDRKR